MLQEHLPEQLAPAAHTLLADFWTNPTHTEPVHAALMAGEFAVHLRTGDDVYSTDEITTWLTPNQLAPPQPPPLSGPISLVVAAASTEQPDDIRQH